MFQINRYITIIKAKIYATKVGQDEFGNLYFEHDYQKTSTGKKKRFCIYNGTPESSRVPPVFHAWLHYSIDNIEVYKFLTKHSWQKPHQINLTGTKFAYNPRGFRVKLQHYNSWKPE